MQSDLRGLISAIAEKAARGILATTLICSKTVGGDSRRLWADPLYGMRPRRRSEPDVSIAELYEVYFSALAVMDQILEFWLTASFAVVVASHFMSSNMGRRLALFLSSVYLLFSAVVAARYIIVASKMIEIRDQLIAADGSYFSGLTQFVGIALAALFLLGCSGVLWFVWSTHKRSLSIDE